MASLAARPASHPLWVFSSASPLSGLVLMQEQLDAVDKHTNVSVKRERWDGCYLESTAAVWTGGIWEHRSSSCCNSEVEMRFRNLGYFSNHSGPRPLQTGSRSGSLARGSCSSRCHRSSPINVWLAVAPVVFRGVASSFGCALVPLDRLIQLNRDMAQTAHSPVKLQKWKLIVSLPENTVIVSTD